ncbi:signal peptidase II [Candidatus Uhrbacteria bacterium]|nr:signal peptidase II [Candidatus Uhrbacteria bacterium]
MALIILDEWLKYMGIQKLPEEGSLIDPGPISFAIHKNWGIAFDFPFRLEFIIICSLLIGAGLVHIAYKNRYKHPDITLAASIIIIGALGNLYDRVVYGFTVDYIILFARSAINLSDIVIVSGVVLLLLSSRRTRKSKRTIPSQPVL